MRIPASKLKRLGIDPKSLPDRISVRQLREQGITGGKLFGGRQNKYNARKTAVGSEVLDSAGEAARYRDLLLMEDAGEIMGLRRQVGYEIIPGRDGDRPVFYRADFQYRLPDGTLVVEDFKGKETEVYRLKKRLMLEVHGIRILETRRAKKGHRKKARRE